MNVSRSATPFLIGVLVAACTVAAYTAREHWLPKPVADDPAPKAHDEEEADEHLDLSEQAIKNLRLTSAPLVPETFWKTIAVPGLVVDRPGLSDRGVPAPATGVVRAIHRLPGDVVNAGDPLFTIRLLSESLHQTQTDLFKTAQDAALARERVKRLTKLAAAGTESESAVVEAEAQVRRLATATRAYRQELLNRGLTAAQVDGVSDGTFVTEMTVSTPPRPADHRPLVASAEGKSAAAFEVQELKAELGQQVQAGQTLCLLANHQSLSIEGRAFREETPLLERAVREGEPIEVDFQEDGAADWPALNQRLVIRHLSNSIDPATRTFTFLLPFENQSRAVEREGRTTVLWRFRPGHPVRLRLRVEKLENVFVLPAEAVVREGGEAFVFRGSGFVYRRRPVHVVHQDSRHAVIANDGSVEPGTKVARAAAAQLNRMLKGQAEGHAGHDHDH